MVEPYSLLKWLHVLSSTVLFGTGLGTAFYFWMAHRTRDPRVIARVGRMVILGDWMFTATSGIAQPITGALLMRSVGIDPASSWLIATYGLYAIAFCCWAPVVWLQIRVTRLAEASLARGGAVDPAHDRLMRIWFLLGWPAFLALIAIFLLMIAKPQLW
jgi:uncharacterized membrane protein